MLSDLSVKDGTTWIDLSEPEAEELAQLAREVELLPLDAEFIVQDHQRPEVAERHNYIAVLIYVPVLDENTQAVISAPLCLIVTPTHLWTVHYRPIAALEKIFDDYTEVPDKFEEYAGDGSLALAMHVISRMYADAYEKIIVLENRMDEEETAVFEGNERKKVEEVAILMRDVMDYRKIVRSQINLFKRAPQHTLFPDELRDQWARLHGQISKLWDILEGLFDDAKELTRTNSSLLVHKENELLRLLTYYMLFLFPMLAIASAMDPYGTSADFSKKIIFWIILITLLAGALGIYWRFKKKRIF